MKNKQAWNSKMYQYLKNVVSTALSQGNPEQI